MWINEAEANGEEGVDDDGNGYVDDIHGYDFANDDSDPVDGHSHGTHCAGTIGAVHNNELGVAGVTADVQLVAIKFLTDRGSGTSANAVRAIDYATTLNVDLMSNSWGGGGASEAMKEAIERASEAGIILQLQPEIVHQTMTQDLTIHLTMMCLMLFLLLHIQRKMIWQALAVMAQRLFIAAPGHKILSTTKNGQYAVYSVHQWQLHTYQVH